MINNKNLLFAMQDNLWHSEDFCIFCPVFEISMLDTRFTNKCFGVAITIGEIPCERESDEGNYKDG